MVKPGLATQALAPSVDSVLSRHKEQEASPVLVLNVPGEQGAHEPPLVPVKPGRHWHWVSEVLSAGLVM